MVKTVKIHRTVADAVSCRLSRRRFLQLSAAGIAALAAGPRLGRAAIKGGKVRLALVGCGGQGTSDMKNMLGGGAQLVALCDVDEHQIGSARGAAKEAGKGAKGYGDYRKLLEDADAFDAVIVATPDNWHAPIATACMKAGKHVFCEKPLAHSISEVRAMRNLYKASNVVTQMGNQGSASASVRRGVEVIKAGGIGQVRDVYIWLPEGAYAHGIQRPAAQPIPAGFNWDFWLGAAPVRPYHSGRVYHPWGWRSWYDFGSGQMGDWGCHALNMAFRGLDLTYPEKVELLSAGAGNKECTPKVNQLIFHFPARPGLDAVKVHWSDGAAKPGGEIVKDILAVHKDPDGCLIIGEKGKIFSDGHNLGALIKLDTDPHFTDINHHAGTKNIPQTLPRVGSHYDEFLEACKGKGKTYSNFETGGHLTEIALSGVVALRVGSSIEWDGPNMKVAGNDAADKFIHIPGRKEWS